MSAVTKPILLDETGIRIAIALENMNVSIRNLSTKYNITQDDEGYLSFQDDESVYQDNELFLHFQKG